MAFMVYLFTLDLHLAITVLVGACPGALVIGAPVSNVAEIRNRAKNRVLFKGGQVMKNLSEVDTLIFDKTGTLTRGNPEVAAVLFLNDVDQVYLLAIAKEVESVSGHHSARSIIRRPTQKTNHSEDKPPRRANEHHLTRSIIRQTIQKTNHSEDKPLRR